MRLPENATCNCRAFVFAKYLIIKPEFKLSMVPIAEVSTVVGVNWLGRGKKFLDEEFGAVKPKNSSEVVY